MRGNSLSGSGGTPQVGAMVTIADTLDTDLTHPDFEHPNLLVDDVLYFSLFFFALNLPIAKQGNSSLRFCTGRKSR